MITFDDHPTSELIFNRVTQVEYFDHQPLDFVVDRHAINFPYLLSATERIELEPYLNPSYLNDRIFIRGMGEATLVTRSTGENLRFIGPDESLHRQYFYLSGKGGARSAAAGSNLEYTDRIMS